MTLTLRSDPSPLCYLEVALTPTLQKTWCGRRDSPSSILYMDRILWLRLPRVWPWNVARLFHNIVCVEDDHDTLDRTMSLCRGRPSSRCCHEDDTSFFLFFAGSACAASSLDAVVPSITGSNEGGLGDLDTLDWVGRTRRLVADVSGETQVPYRARYCSIVRNVVPRSLAYSRLDSTDDVIGHHT